MAAPTKTGVELIASTSVAAGGTETSAARDVSTKFGAVVSMRVTNGSTGPTNACRATIEIRRAAAADWFPWRSFLADNRDNEVSPFSERVPVEAFEYRVSFTGHTGQSVTVQADAVEIDSIS